MIRFRKNLKILFRSDGDFAGITVPALIIIVALIAFSCASVPVLYEKGVSVAVWDLDDLSPSAVGNMHLGGLLSGQVIETLQKNEYAVVERQRLLLALEELHLGSSSLADEATRLRLGRMVGARLMVFGGYMAIGDKMRLDLRVVEVETGKVLKAVQKTILSGGDMAWLDVARKAAEELVERKTKT